MNSTSGSEIIPTFRMGLALLCPFIVIIISFYFKLGIEWKLTISVVRTIIQLLLAGYILLGFIFSMNSPIYVVLYLFVMTLIAALESTTRQTRTYSNHYYDSFTAILFGGGGVGLYGSLVVFNPTPWWNPHTVVPSVGMLIGNAVSGPSLAVERLLSDICNNRHEIETRLAFGASRFEAVLPTVRSAVLAALVQNLNQMAVVGLVAIPGMMTGQLLGGADPLTAAEYQMAILWLICATTAFSACIGIYLALIHAVIDSNHRITIEKIIEKKEKLSLDFAFIRAFQTSLDFMIKFCQRRNDYRSVEVREDAEKLNSDLELATIGVTNDLEEPFPSYKVTYTIIENTSIPEMVISSSSESDTSELMELCLDTVNVFVSESKADLLFSPENGLKLTVQPQDRVCIEGPSGIGKTRLFRAIAQLDSFSSGKISYLDMQIDCPGPNLNSMLIPKWRTHVVYVPQALPPMAGSPKDLLLECLQYRSRSGLHNPSTMIKDLDQECQEVEKSLLLSNGKMNQKWSALSGGERQRCAIGVGILQLKSNQITRRGVLLLDEPTAACDVESCAAVEKTLMDSGFTILFITHDDSQADRFATKRVILKAREQF